MGGGFVAHIAVALFRNGHGIGENVLVTSTWDAWEIQAVETLSHRSLFAVATIPCCFAQTSDCTQNEHRRAATKNVVLRIRILIQVSEPKKG